jgi:hypothetical protein
MIRRITLVNFMSHVQTVIEPAPGLTAIVGPNNSGKSAVVAALQILCQNESSTYVLRHGQRDCSVVVETDDGHTIEWARKGGSPRYVIDGKEFDRLSRSGLPEELHRALRMPRVAAVEGKEEFDVHFGEQKRPIFLLDKPPSHAAQFFASSSDAAKLVEMQKRHQEKSRDANRRRTECEAESARLAKSLEALEPVPGLSARVSQAEKDRVGLDRRVAAIVEAKGALAGLRRQVAEVAHRDAQATALRALASPPVLADPAPLEKLIGQLGRGADAVDLQTARVASVEALHTPPPLADETALAELIDKTATVALACDRASGAVSATRSLANPPAMHEVSLLGELVDEIEEAGRRVGHCDELVVRLADLGPAPKAADTAPLDELLRRIEEMVADALRQQAAVAQAEDDLEATREELRSWALENRICPTCGGEIDPDRLVAGAGRHVHV